MSTSQDDQIDQLVQARWRAIGLSQADLAEILCAGASLQKNGVDGTVKIDTGRLATVAEMLGVAADILNRRPATPTQTHGGHASESLQSLLELRMLRVFRDVKDPDTKRILIELAEQIVKRQTTPSETG
ncbi:MULTISPECIES: hypothetical protein [unclassified Bradyrhizobium]|uniref:hypothetical protein n=1 Tax=unclassified Bradyrhizobium TaxID=2631580 RepID=UPI001BA8EA94|nr:MULTISPECIES: hypothetical protein [unclassified Bradyrhizobium]MBR1207988.1 hypothetical protein [Bradyrhizobium sp. AUGA SZCCT0124]MBR1314504.1 hypothetical protein [Bradyrhizobium sp. AUGA SZCCT0051]MBR1342478.1 hypothetical protein [Bradyrhizobium sp. AUGA SZCCT0105]MBR1352708.1 hypothetical protein [Bradyrhizobium sp. AUGA SZCCT0045]